MAQREHPLPQHRQPKHPHTHVNLPKAIAAIVDIVFAGINAAEDYATEAARACRLISPVTFYPLGFQVTPNICSPIRGHVPSEIS